MKGKKHTIESINKQRLSHTGKKQSLESKNKKSKAVMGEKNGMYKKSLFNLWTEKYGIEEANKKYELYKNNMSNIKCKIK